MINILQRAITHIQNEIFESYFTYLLEIAFDNSNFPALFILDFNLVPDRALFLQPIIN